MRIFAHSIVGLWLVVTGCGGDDDRPATWSYIHAAIIAPNCATASCHADTTAVAGVRLHSKAAAYSALLGRACDGNHPIGEAPRNYVDPGHPEASRLVYLLRGEEVSRPMPPDRMLPLVDVELIEKWILEGALCD